MDKTMQVCDECLEALTGAGFRVETTGEKRLGECECCHTRTLVYPAMWDKKKKE